MRASLLMLVAGAALAFLPSQAPPDRNREAAYRANNVGVARLEQFDYEGAAQAFRQALKVQPELAIARLNLAIALFYGGKAPEAAVEAQAAVERLPGVPQAHYMAGLIARAEDKLEAATPAFERVLKLDPADAGAKVNLGQIALQQRQYERALTLFTEALAAEPYNVTAAYSLALALTRAGKADDGRKAMERFEALRDSAYGVTYAQTYLSQGKYAEAIASTGDEAELVDGAAPVVTFSDATAEMLPSREPTAGAPGGGVTLFDADSDGDLDLLDVGGTSLRLWRNTGKAFSDDGGKAGLTMGGSTRSVGAIAGDYDNDGRPDVFVLGAGGHRLYRQAEQGRFVEVEAFRLKAEATRGGAEATRGAAEATRGAAAAALADFDHDGDLDILIAGSPTQLLRNNGNGTFADIAVQAAVSAPMSATALVATDYDNRRDVDIVAATADRGVVLYRNLRDGSFRNVAGEAGLPAEGAFSALAAGDVNKDGFPDFFLGRPSSAGLLALSDGQARFRTSPAPDATAGAIAAQFVDYDNDGLLDLLTGHASRISLLRNIGGGRWSDVSTSKLFPAVQDLRAVALGDVDGDGDTDAVLRPGDGRLRIWRNDGGSRRPSLRVRLTALVSNRSGIGARVEMRAGSLRQQLVATASTPAVAPADLIFGLGAREGADVLRVLWPSGILQAETASGAELLKPGVMPVTELDRKPSSCPYLFTWNGSRFEFVTDFLGGGEMGAWLGPGTWNVPDPDEYVRLDARQLQPQNGRYQLRITNELEEALFVDRVQLVAVDHPSAVEVFPNEGLRSAPRPPFALTAVRGARPPLRALDEHGHDVLPHLTAVDRRYPDDFALVPIRGYAASHSLTLQLDPDAGDDAVLLMTGWTDYAFSNDNVAASQLGVAMAPPSIQVRDSSGGWQTVIPETGFPVGRPQTIVASMHGKWLSSSREVRVITNMRIYWDQILVGTPDRDGATRLTRLDPSTADLRWRGFSAEHTPDGREPYGYDYTRVSTTTPWKLMVGRYTREGDVQPLLRGVDDMYVISRPGDEIAVEFEAGALPPLAPGSSRTFLFYAHGWSKEMNPRSASPDAVGPLPFFRMSGYPYGPGEHYPRTDLHREYQQKYNTRVVSRPVLSIDAFVR